MSIRKILAAGVTLALLFGCNVYASEENESMNEDRITSCDLILAAETGEQIYIDEGSWVILHEITETDAVISYYQYKGCVPRMCLKSIIKEVIQDGSPLRFKPSNDGEVLHEMIKGTEVEVLSWPEEGWSKIIYRGRCGYCRNSDLS